MKVTNRWKRRIAFQNSARKTGSSSPTKVKRLSAEVSSERPSVFSYQIRPRPLSGLSIATTMIFPVSGHSESVSGSFSRSSSERAFFAR